VVAIEPRRAKHLVDREERAERVDALIFPIPNSEINAFWSRRSPRTRKIEGQEIVEACHILARVLLLRCPKLARCPCRLNQRLLSIGRRRKYQFVVGVRADAVGPNCARSGW
jgi:hypothetical protein